MNWKTTIALLIIVVGLGVYLKFYELKLPDTAEAKRQSSNVVNFSRDKITGILIQNGDDKIEIKRQGDKWRLETPFKDQADPAAIQNLLGDLDGWQKEATISAKEIDADKNKLPEYGLNKPKLRLKLIGDQMPPEILFGKEAALEGKMYVRFDSSKETYLTSQTIRKDIEKKPEEFRDKRLTDLTPAMVSRVVLKTNAGEMELQKKSDHWEISKPLRVRGDDQKVNDLIAQVTTARIEEFVASDSGDLHPYGLAEPRGSITLYEQSDKSGSGSDQARMLQIGNAKEKDHVYVRFTARNFVYTLPKKIEEILNTKPDDLRDRHLARIDTNILDRITLETPGKTKTVLARKQENWTIVNLNNLPANSAEVRRMLDAFQNEQVVSFVEDTVSNLSKYGLDKPLAQVTFSSFASENTPETPAGERPFATITFGKIEGDNVYARAGEEPFIVTVRRTLPDQAASDPSQWQELPIFKTKSDDIRRLSVTTTTESSLERGDDKKWHWKTGTGEIDQTNLQSLLNTLSTLRAVRWINPNTPQTGLDKPQLVVTFATSAEGKDSRKLTVGATNKEGTTFARVDDRQGVFTISTPDLSALKLPLVKQAATAPSPSPSQSATPTPSPAK